PSNYSSPTHLSTLSLHDALPIFIDLFSPVRGRDFFECDRDGLVSVIQDLHDVLRDRLGESPLLLFGFSWPQLHDHVRHYSLPYCSSLTFSIQSTGLPLRCS